MEITLQKTTQQDLEILFEFQCDPIATQMAAFTSKDPTNKTAYITKWGRLITDDAFVVDSIWFDSTLVGTICKYDMENEPQISYWIDRKQWGRGFATKALQLFANKLSQRPLFARAAFDNIGSQKVLENCQFEEIGRELFFAEARGKEIEEIIYQLS